MGILDSIKGQLIDIIEWTSTDPDILARRFERRNNEIKMGAKLVVREGQNAVFVNEGKVGDIFTPGTYTLSTQNLPVLTDLKGWMYGFNSPFKAEVYFISTLTLSNRKWGTPNPVMLRDQELGVVRLRAFGTYAYAVEEAGSFFRTAVGTLAEVQAGELESQLKSFLVEALSDALGEAQIPAFDLAAKYLELGILVQKSLTEKFASYGLGTRQLDGRGRQRGPVHEVQHGRQSRRSHHPAGRSRGYACGCGHRPRPRRPVGRQLTWDGRPQSRCHAAATPHRVDLLRSRGRSADRPLHAGAIQADGAGAQGRQGFAGVEGRHGRLGHRCDTAGRGGPLFGRASETAWLNPHCGGLLLLMPVATE
jgi:hypothetical protein